MTSEELKDRTKQVALDVVNLTSRIPHGREADVLCRQFLRSATSVGANYRSACRARSKVDFINKIQVVEEEADESLYWLELISKSQLADPKNLEPLVGEFTQLTAIFTASGRTAKYGKK